MTLRTLLALAFLLAIPRDAGAQERFRAVVRVVSEDDKAIARRITGQVTDLSVDVILQDKGPLEGGIGKQITTADQMAATLTAGAVVWFERVPGGLLVVLAEARTGRVLVRRIDDDSAALKSATLEAVALIVRSSVRLLAEGGTIGVERKEIAPTEPATKPATTNTTRATPTIQPRPFNAPPPPSWRPWLDVGVSMSIERDAQQPIFSIPLGWGLEYGAFVSRLELGVPTNPAIVTDTHATLHVWRPSILFTFGALLVRSRLASLALEGGVGAAFYIRQTSDPTGGAVGAPTASTGSFLLEARAVLRLALSSRFRLMLGTGLSWVMAPFVSGYAKGSEFVPIFEAQAVFPRIFIGFQWSPTP